MSIYRANPRDGVAWVTGGSAGIGRELVLELTRAGFDVAVTWYPKHSLDGLLEACKDHPGRLAFFPCDVASARRMRSAVAAIEATLGPIALAILNAGTFQQTRGEHLDLGTIRRIIDVNLLGVVNGLVPAVARMDRRNRGHIVIIGSASAYFGWPTAAAYGSSKAALNNLAASLRYDFDKMNIRIQIVNPGFVETGLTAHNPLMMPAVMSSRSAAQRIMKGIRGGGFEVTFPRRLTWLLKLIGLLPASLAFAVISVLTGARGRPLVRGGPAVNRRLPEYRRPDAG